MNSSPKNHFMPIYHHSALASEMHGTVQENCASVRILAHIRLFDQLIWKLEKMKTGEYVCVFSLQIENEQKE